jgi:transcriptional regulator with XRE-family HTH domain
MTHQLFGQWLRQARRALDLTQEALAERVACAATTIRTFESGARRPSRAMAERLADVLAIPPGDRAAFLQLARARPADRASAAAGSPPANVVAIRPSVTQRDAKRLPRLLTSFIGRQAEVAELERLLGDLRLLTLTGPGCCSTTAST